MAVKLRLRRMGKKRQPVYKVVAADARSPRDGKFIEAIGLYNPKTEPATVEIKEDRALYWLGVGAQPTDTVKNLLSSKGILLRRELTKRGLSEEQIETEIAEWKSAKESVFEAKQAAKQKKEEVVKGADEKSETVEQEKVDSSASEVEGAASDKADEEQAKSAD